MNAVAAPSLRLRSIAAACIVGLGGISAAAAQTYAVTDLGVLPGYASCMPRGLSEPTPTRELAIVGECAPAVANFNQMGFVWKASSGMSPVGKLAKGQYSSAVAINASGVIVGDGDTGDFRPQGWIKKGTSLINFFPNNGGNTHALSVTDNGRIGGFYTKSLSGNTSSWKGAIWTVDPKKSDKYNVKDLPVLPGGIDPATISSVPSAFNPSLQAAGYASNDQIGQHAAFWNNDATNSIVDLGVYPGDWSSVAYGINGFGQVVGSSHPPFGSRPVLWGNDPARTPTELPVLPGDNYGMAAAINNAGQIIGTSYYGTPGTWDATPARLVVWRDGAVFELQSLLDVVSGAGLTLTALTAINNLGQIVGTAVRADGATRAVLLTPQ